MTVKENKMKTLVVFYSRDGATRKVAASICDLLNADMEEIIDKRNRKGIFGYIKAGFESVKNRTTEIEPEKFDASLYELVIIGTPIWAGRMVPAIRTYLTQNNGKIKRTALFAVKANSPAIKAFEAIESLTNIKPEITFELKEKQVKSLAYLQPLKEKLAELK